MKTIPNDSAHDKIVTVDCLRKVDFDYAGNLGGRRESPAVEEVGIVCALLIRVDERLRPCSADEAKGRFKAEEKYAYRPYLLGRRAGNNRWNDISLFNFRDDGAGTNHDLGALTSETVGCFNEYYLAHVPAPDYAREKLIRKLAKDYNIHSFLLNISPVALPEGTPPPYCVQTSATRETVTAYFYYLYGVERYTSLNCHVFRTLEPRERKKLADIIRADRFGLFEKFLTGNRERADIADISLEGETLILTLTGGARLRFPAEKDEDEGIEILNRLQMDQLNELASRDEAYCIPLEYFDPAINGRLNRNLSFHSLLELLVRQGPGVASLLHLPQTLVTKYRRPAMAVTGIVGLMYVGLANFREVYAEGQCLDPADIIRSYHGDIVSAVLRQGGEVLNATGEYACALFYPNALTTGSNDAAGMYRLMLAAATELLSLGWDLRISVETRLNADFFEGHIGSPEMRGVTLSSVSSYIVATLGNRVRAIDNLHSERSLLLPCDLSEDVLREHLADVLLSRTGKARNLALGIRTLGLDDGEDYRVPGKMYYQVYVFLKGRTAMDELWRLFKDKPEETDREILLAWRSPLAVICHFNSFRYVFPSVDDIRSLFHAARSQVNRSLLICGADRDCIISALDNAEPYVDEWPGTERLGRLLDMGDISSPSIKEEFELADGELLSCLKEAIPGLAPIGLPSNWPLEILVNRRESLSALKRLAGILHGPRVAFNADGFTLITGERGERFYLHLFQPRVTSGRREDLRLQEEDELNLIALFERKMGDFCAIKNSLARYFDFIFERFDGTRYLCLAASQKGGRYRNPGTMNRIPHSEIESVLPSSARLGEAGIRFTLAFTVLHGGAMFPSDDVQPRATHTMAPWIIVICYRPASVDRIITAFSREDGMSGELVRGYSLATVVLDELYQGGLSLSDCRIAIIHRNNTDKGFEEGDALKRLISECKRHGVSVLLYSDGYIPDGFKVITFAGESHIIVDSRLLLDKITEIAKYETRKSVNPKTDELSSIFTS